MDEYLICYDIRDPRRLQRLHRHLKRYAVPIQYSVFLFTGSERRLDQCLAEAETIIDSRADDLRAYPLPKRGLKVRLGRSALPEGIYWSPIPQQW